MQRLDQDRWRRVQSILDRALELGPEERLSWLETACAGEPALRAEVEGRLRADATTGAGLDTRTDAFDQLAVNDPNPSPTSGRARFLPGTVLAGRYRVVTLLGGGGMGEVYRADDLKLGQPVALKFLSVRLRENPDLLQWLLREARIARQVSHPNVCRVYDVGDADGQTFLTMEFIDGEDLRSLLRRIGRLPHHKAVDIARQLCAGLQAAHESGVLHRDLKPANVMLDARGRVRITDFGIAALAGELPQTENRPGTPLYMAPEQLDGAKGTVRTDVYALGLVLYELFCGRRPFEATDIEHLRRAQEDSTPPRPALLVEGIDPAIERTILGCLESDPELRPRSPAAVAAALPDGDPIDAALQAGETPSPELVAASGPDGSLRPAHAFGVLGATLAMLCVLLALADRVSIVGWVQWPRSPDALEDHARGMLSRLGHTNRAQDRARSLLLGNGIYRRYVRAHDASRERWTVLREAAQWDALFWYRQSPGVLVPWNPDARVGSEDPAAGPGDATVLTDLSGRLIWLLVIPEQAAPPAAAADPPDWSALFREAGLDPAKFEPVSPTVNPPVTADTRAAWSGIGAGGYPVRAEAAAYRGRPVFFEQVVPWDPYWDPRRELQSSPPFSSRDTMMVRLFALLSLIVMPALAAAFVARNWLSGRVDRKGAFRLAAFVFCLRFAVWLLGAHHVPSLADEWVLFTIGLGKALVDAAASWILYVAVEPHARRLHARFLVSWNRLVRGRVRDPLVGRDVLGGAALATLTILFWAQLPVALPHALGHASAPPPAFHPLGGLPYLYFLNAPPPETLLGGRYVLEALAGGILTTFGIALTFLIVLLGLHMLLRNFYAALALYAALVATISPMSEAAGYSAISVACSLMGTLVFVWGLRFGLVGGLVLWFVVVTWMNFPVTAKVDAPHFGTGLVALLVIAGLATFGAVNASRTRVSAMH